MSQLKIFSEASKKITVVAGHYGTGKTNVAVNLALESAASGKTTVIADIDIVNPYFRTADAVKRLENAGVICIVPEYANTNVDLPTLPPQLYSIVSDAARGMDVRIILDVGGDDDGAAALGGLRASIEEAGYDMLFTINSYRPLTALPEDAVCVLRDIEARCGLRATHIVNNSNLGEETEAITLLDSLPYAEKVCEITGLPLLCHTALNRLEGELAALDKVLFIENVTKSIWNTK